MSDFLASQLKAFESTLSKMSKAQASSAHSREELDELIDKLLAEDPKPVASSDPSPAEDPSEDRKDHGLLAKLEKLTKDQEKLQAKLDEAEKRESEKETRIIEQRREHAAITRLKDMGAKNPTHAYKLFKDQIINDDDIGDAVPVKTEAGDDVVSLEEFIPMFAEENEYLFGAQPQSGRGGSGAGEGGPGVPKGKKKPDDLRSPREGGMSMAEYAKLSPEEKEQYKQVVEQ